MMKLIEKIGEIMEAFTIKVPIAWRIVFGVILVGGIGSAIILSVLNPGGNQLSK